MTNNERLWVSVSEAVRLTGKSERTVRRWMAGGKVPTRDNAAGLQVGLTGEMVVRGRQEEATPDMPDMAARVVELEADARRLQALLEQVTGERDYLRQALAAALTLQQKALPKPSGNPWWQFWRRSEQAAV